MSRQLSINVPDETFANLAKRADAAGLSPAQVVEAALEREFAPRPVLTEAEREAAFRRMEKHFGAASLGYATGTDNERIDADIAASYADNHEEGG